MYINIMQSANCWACGGLKAKEVKTTTMVRVEDWFYIPIEGEAVGKVFCSECGLVYYEKSI
jgi:hypothetical protein